MAYNVTEFLGDGIGTELMNAVHTVADGLPVDISFSPVDLTLENRREESREVYEKALASISETRCALKYPTVTENESPNAVLRKMCDFSVIHRPVMTIPGVKSNFKQTLNIDIIRIATGGTYDDPGRLIGNDGAVSIRVVERHTTRTAAIYAFELAERQNTSLVSGSKYTIQKVTDGMFEEVITDLESDYPTVTHRRVLFDALLAEIIMHPDRFSVIVVLNEYGDFLSDMACGLVGSIGIGSSGSYSFHEDGTTNLAMFDPSGGTAPDIAGKNIANPTGMFLAFAQLLSHLGEDKISKIFTKSMLDLLAEGATTADLGGTLSTTDFTEAVVERTRSSLK